MHVFAGHWQIFELPQDVTPQFCQVTRIVCPDIKRLFVLVDRVGVEPYREHGEFASTSGSLVQPTLVGVKTRRAVCIYIAYAAMVLGV